MRARLTHWRYEDHPLPAIQHCNAGITSHYYECRRERPGLPTSEPHDERASVTGAAWYEQLRLANKPDVLRVLLVGESPPDPGLGDRRFFYAPVLAAHDNLYRGVAAALYGTEPSLDIRDKPAVLKRLRNDGFWLIDALEDPVNHLTRRERLSRLRLAAPRLAERVSELRPSEGVIVCHSLVFDACADRIRRSGIPLMHEAALPFPLGNWRARFIDEMRRALTHA